MNYHIGSGAKAETEMGSGDDFTCFCYRFFLENKHNIIHIRHHSDFAVKRLLKYSTSKDIKIKCYNVMLEKEKYHFKSLSMPRFLKTIILTILYFLNAAALVYKLVYITIKKKTI